jgi:predicted cation transporter
LVAVGSRAYLLITSRRHRRSYRSISNLKRSISNFVRLLFFREGRVNNSLCVLLSFPSFFQTLTLRLAIHTIGRTPVGIVGIVVVVATVRVDNVHIVRVGRIR